jgi:hypothetical protein
MSLPATRRRDRTALPRAGLAVAGAQALDAEMFVPRAGPKCPRRSISRPNSETMPSSTSSVKRNSITTTSSPFPRNRPGTRSISATVRSTKSRICLIGPSTKELAIWIARSNRSGTAAPRKCAAHPRFRPPSKCCRGLLELRQRPGPGVRSLKTPPVRGPWHRGGVASGEVPRAPDRRPLALPFA